MWIIEDSLQQIKPVDKHSIKHAFWEQNKDTVFRTRLPAGDYALPPKVSVDTKSDMDEIASNIGGSAAEHKRFKNELILARDMGTKLYILIENDLGITNTSEVANWKNPRRFISPKAIDGQRLSRAMKTMEERYGCTFVFCSPEDAAKRINELLLGG